MQCMLFARTNCINHKHYQDMINLKKKKLFPVQNSSWSKNKLCIINTLPRNVCKHATVAKPDLSAPAFAFLLLFTQYFG